MQVSVTSADKGDIVLVIWSDEHSNYQVYHEVLVIVGCLYRDKYVVKHKSAKLL